MKFKPPTVEEVEIFDAARRRWPGVKRGCKTELDNLCKKHDDWKKILPLLVPAIEFQEQKRVKMAKKGEFVPARKHFQTWINNRCWEETEGQEFTVEEFKAQYDRYLEDKKQALEKIRQQKREEYEAWQNWPKEKLRTMREDNHWTHLWWLIDEILTGRRTN